ncbi:hypothetical protein EDF68_101993 [Ochrobactrum sp. BH3]|nr:hypothetical protein EDF68_101993 [Ochrobactrum sp. BH3]
MPYGCDEGDLAIDGCAVAHGLDYAAQISAMRVHYPGYVEQIEWNADLRERKAQQRRNMRALRLH